jgi:hypothetical protein
MVLYVVVEFGKCMNDLTIFGKRPWVTWRMIGRCRRTSWRNAPLSPRPPMGHCSDVSGLPFRVIFRRQGSRRLPLDLPYGDSNFYMPIIQGRNQGRIQAHPGLASVAQSNRVAKTDATWATLTGQIGKRVPSSHISGGTAIDRSAVVV